MHSYGIQYHLKVQAFSLLLAFSKCLALKGFCWNGNYSVLYNDDIVQVWESRYIWSKKPRQLLQSKFLFDTLTHKTSLVSVVYYATMLIQSSQSCCCGRQPHFLLTKPWSALCLKRNQALFMPIQAMCKSMKCQTQERDFSLSLSFPIYVRWFPQHCNSSFSSPDCR